MSKDKPTPQDRYNKKSTKLYSVKVVRTTESDILAKLESVPNRSRYIKDLIRQDINKEGST